MLIDHERESCRDMNGCLEINNIFTNARTYPCTPTNPRLGTANTMVARKVLDPLDGPPFVVGVITLLHQFHSSHTHRFMALCGQYIRYVAVLDFVVRHNMMICVRAWCSPPCCWCSSAYTVWKNFGGWFGRSEERARTGGRPPSGERTPDSSTQCLPHLPPICFEWVGLFNPRLGCHDDASFRWRDVRLLPAEPQVSG